MTSKENYTALDQLDKRILTLLQSDSSQNTKEIAEQIGLSVSPTHERIKKLEENGFIKRYVAVLDRSKINKNLLVFIQITLSKHSRARIENFIESASKIKEVLSYAHVSGSFDFLIQAAVEDMEAYRTLVMDKLSVITEISSLQSSFVLNEIPMTDGFHID